MAVRLRMKKLGRNKRPFFRICAMDSRAPRDGKVIEELGHYDPLVKDADARAILNGERIAYWLSVGAQPSENVQVLIKKYGKDGTRLAEQQVALERIKTTRPMAPAPYIPPPKPAEPPAAEEAPAAEAPAEQPAEEPAADAAAEAPAG
ncbi:MAG TPA: 30S ribosomal protein S16 [Pirellulaceae bacterium]|nr:30S ribosomal protein S16 [Pirellulaceae bacterium]